MHEKRVNNFVSVYSKLKFRELNIKATQSKSTFIIVASQPISTNQTFRVHSSSMFLSAWNEKKKLFPELFLSILFFSRNTQKQKKKSGGRKWSKYLYRVTNSDRYEQTNKKKQK